MDDPTFVDRTENLLLFQLRPDHRRLNHIHSRSIGRFSVVRANLSNVILSFSYGRNLSQPFHEILTGIVCGQREAQISLKLLKQKFHVADATVDVLFRIEEVPYAETCTRSRDQLHQSEG